MYSPSMMAQSHHHDHHHDFHELDKQHKYLGFCGEQHMLKQHPLDSCRPSITTTTTITSFCDGRLCAIEKAYVRFRSGVDGVACQPMR